MDIINRVRLKIGGKQYTISTPESEDYVREIGAKVEERLSAILQKNAALSVNDALILCLLDSEDARRKSEKNADHIREQLTGYLEDAAKARMEADELRQEAARLRRALAIVKGEYPPKNAGKNTQGDAK
jgi:cell division protein ZapA (FtsZ GTPase activity inhibitor)